MFNNDNPVGWAYILTFQASFHIVELVVVLVSWALLASQHIFTSPGLSFAFGAFLFIWLITLVFFILYITGLTIIANKRWSKMANRDERNEQSCCNTDTPCFVLEYVIYFVIIVLLVVASILMSMHAHNAKFIATAVLGWLAFIIYLVHFILLVQSAEGLWPHQALFRCCSGSCEASGGSRCEEEDEERRILLEETASQ